MNVSVIVLQFQQRQDLNSDWLWVWPKPRPRRIKVVRGAEGSLPSSSRQVPTAAANEDNETVSGLRGFGVQKEGT